MKLLTTIPFQGFYESIHDAYVSEAIIANFDDREGTGEHKTPWGDTELNYRKACQEYAWLYTSAMSEALKIPLEFESLESPKYYNYTTDRIFCRIPLDAVEKLRAEFTEEELERAIRARFTSRDGFASHYPNSLEGEEWQKPLSEWDHNQIGVLIELKADSELSEHWETYALDSFCFRETGISRICGTVLRFARR